MAITPQDIEQLTFSPSKHGYDTDEVDAFLEQLAVEVDAMLQKIADLKGRLNASEQALDQARAQVASLEAREMTAPAAPVPVAAATSGPTERQISQALIVAQQSADRIVAEARDNAEKIRNEADAKAREVIRQALAEKQNELDEIDRLKASREEFRTEYKNLLQHFMDDAEAAFPSQLLTSATGSAQPRYEVPAQAESVDVNATVYVTGGSAMGVNVDDLD
jgi:cell division initiation protein